MGADAENESDEENQIGQTDAEIIAQFGAELGEDLGQSPTLNSMFDNFSHLIPVFSRSQGTTSGKEPFYVKDPRKALRNYFEREREEMEFSYDETGPGHARIYTCAFVLFCLKSF